MLSFRRRRLLRCAKSKTGTGFGFGKTGRMLASPRFARWLEEEFAGQLDRAGLVLLRQRYTSKARTSWIGIGRREARMVEDIERVQSQLQVATLGKSELVKRDERRWISRWWPQYEFRRDPPTRSVTGFVSLLMG